MIRPINLIFFFYSSRTRVKTPRRKVTPRPVTRRPTTARRTPTRRPKSTGLERIETGVNVLNTVADSAQTIHGMVQPPVQQRSFDEELVDLEARYFEELDARYAFFNQSSMHCLTVS